MRLATLKKRAEFQRVRGGGRCSTAGFLLEGKARPADGRQADGRVCQARFGFTVTKKLGGAVERNRIRRRLKAAIAETAPQLADPAFDYVVVARPPAFDRPFAELRDDFAVAYRRVASTARAPATEKMRSKPRDNPSSDKN